MNSFKLVELDELDLEAVAGGKQPDKKGPKDELNPQPLPPGRSRILQR
jgi:hypothetical protein